MEEESQFLGNEDHKHAGYKEILSSTYTVLAFWLPLWSQRPNSSYAYSPPTSYSSAKRRKCLSTGT